MHDCCSACRNNAPLHPDHRLADRLNCVHILYVTALVRTKYDPDSWRVAIWRHLAGFGGVSARERDAKARDHQLKPPRHSRRLSSRAAPTPCWPNWQATFALVPPASSVHRRADRDRESFRSGRHRCAAPQGSAARASGLWQSGDCAPHGTRLPHGGRPGLAFGRRSPSLDRRNGVQSRAAYRSICTGG